MKKMNQKGFTLVELMLVVGLSGIVLASIVSFFQSQQKSYIDQEEVTEMQQELRSALEIMSREIRNAGHVTPTNPITPKPGFSSAGPFQVGVTMDLTDNPGTGDPDGDIADANEDVTFGFSAANDADGDGIADSGAADLGRDTGGGFQDLSSNIHAVGLAYAYDDSDSDNNLETNATSGEVIWAVPDGAGGWIDLDSNNDGVVDENDSDPAATGNATAAQRNEIRAVRIWILARGSRTDPDYVDGNIYKVGANTIPAPNDNFRRRLLSMNIRCRNMGLQ